MVEFPDHYEVSNLGGVRRISSARGTSAGRVRRTHLMNGYPALCLKIGRRPFMRYVHRMIAEAFIGPIPKGWHVNHKDGVKSNSVLSNLEIVTIGENRAHSYRVLGIPPNRGKLGVEHHNARLSWEQVCEVRAAYNDGVGPTELGRRYGLSRQGIHRIVTGKVRAEA